VRDRDSCNTFRPYFFIIFLSTRVPVTVTSVREIIKSVCRSVSQRRQRRWPQFLVPPIVFSPCPTRFLYYSVYHYEFMIMCTSSWCPIIIHSFVIIIIIIITHLHNRCLWRFRRRFSSSFSRTTRSRLTKHLARRSAPSTVFRRFIRAHRTTNATCYNI